MAILRFCYRCEDCGHMGIEAYEGFGCHRCDSQNIMVLCHEERRKRNKRHNRDGKSELEKWVELHRDELKHRDELNFKAERMIDDV